MQRKAVQGEVAFFLTMKLQQALQWIYKTRTVASKGENRMSKLHLTISDRIRIEGMLNNGFSFAGIGRTVGKNRSTISREVQNN